MRKSGVAANSVITIAYGMMGTLGSGTGMNPLCGRYVQIENPANGKMARGMVVGKCMDCVNGKTSGVNSGYKRGKIETLQ